MNAPLVRLARERERLVASIELQRHRMERAYAALRNPIRAMDRVREAARYVLAHRTALGFVFTLLAVGRRARARRRLVRAARLRRAGR